MATNFGRAEIRFGREERDNHLKYIDIRRDIQLGRPLAFARGLKTVEVL
jgi:hypothetical protein